jgi:small subunit ribosomal protein S19
MAEDKLFKYRGKTLEELKTMSFEDFTKLLPSILRRKVSRGFSEQEQILLANIRAGGKKFKTHCRDMIVLPEMVGLKMSIYSGKEFVELNIVEEMIAMRFGELVPTRKIATHTSMGAKRTTVRK